MTHDWLAEMIYAAFLEQGPEALVNNSPLLNLAAAFGRLDLVLWLLDGGADTNQPDQRGRTPLFFAADRRMARTLIQAGADIEHTDPACHKPLHAAVRAGRLDVAHALTLAGADIHATDRRGMTTLHTAAMKGRLKCVEHLIELGANPNAQNRKGRHPLFYAVAGGHLGTAKRLIAMGADLDMLDDAGTSWLSLARMDQVAALQAAYKQTLEAEADLGWDPGTMTLPGRTAVRANGESARVGSMLCYRL